MGYDVNPRVGWRQPWAVVSDPFGVKGTETAQGGSNSDCEHELDRHKSDMSTDLRRHKMGTITSTSKETD